MSKFINIVELDGKNIEYVNLDFVVAAEDHCITPGETYKGIKTTEIISCTKISLCNGKDILTKEPFAEILQRYQKKQSRAWITEKTARDIQKTIKILENDRLSQQYFSADKQSDKGKEKKEKRKTRKKK